MKKAVILLSGGLDSATVLAMAQHQGYACYALSVDYGQRHHAELNAARLIAQTLGAVEQRTMHVDLTGLGGSALTDKNIPVPTKMAAGIPLTYVPARNTVMLSLALAWAEVLQSTDIFLGVNAVDYSGYPDCRPEYIAAFEKMANLATKSAVMGQFLTIHAPLQHMSKAEIIKAGINLGVDFSLTVSCYQADLEGQACAECDSCRLRKVGFEQAGIADVTRYREHA